MDNKPDNKESIISNWQIKPVNKNVDKEINKLPIDLQAKFLRIAKLIEDDGVFGIAKPYVKSLSKGLWEIRIKGQSGIARALFVIKNKEIIILHVFIKKTQKPPPKTIALAQKRLQDYELHKKT